MFKFSSVYSNLFLLFLFLPDHSLLASGWVKEAGKYYLKLSHSSTEDKAFTATSEDMQFEEIEQPTAFYGEVGLPYLPWNSQLSVSFANKRITRKALEAGDKHTSQGLSDTQLKVKHQLGTFQFSPVGIAVSLTTGGNIPTTRERFREGNENQRFGDFGQLQVRDFLVSSLDKGKAGYIYGYGISSAYRFLWLGVSQEATSFSNFGQGLKPGVATTEVSFGSALPFNSWVQTFYRQFREFAYADGISDNTWATKGASIGLTFFQGAALEVAYSQSSSLKQGYADYQVIEVGVSYRSI